MLQVVGAGASDAEFVRSRLAASRWNLDAKFVGQVTSRERVRHLQNLVVSASPDDFSAILPGARTKVENAVGGAHDVGIVLHHQNRVSQVAQVVQNLDKPVRIAAVQANGGLVKHVQRADQTRAERSRQLNALRFAARKRRGETVERQILQANFVKETQPFPKFDQQPVGNGGLFGR